MIVIENSNRDSVEKFTERVSQHPTGKFIMQDMYY